MEVWTVFASTFGDSDTTVGVYSSAEAAKAAIDDYEAANHAAWAKPNGSRYFSVAYDIRGPFILDAADWSPYRKTSS